jgi:hypothetical protein
MPVDDILRLAWQAERDGRPGTCDALMMLAIAESGPGEAVIAERCRRRLISRQPDHWLASFPTLGQALSHSRIARAVRQLRAMFPPIRVQHLLFRDDVRRGPYTGRPRPSWAFREDLVGPAPQPHRESGRAEAPSSETEVAALLFPPGSKDAADPNATVLVYYLTVLLAIAILLASVIPPSAQDTQAA